MRTFKSSGFCVILGLLACASTACAAYHPGEPVSDGRDISKVNGGIELEAGSSAGNISSVNGGVNLGARSHAVDVSNVNGGIHLGDSVSVQSLEGVNGGISGGSDVQIAGDISTVNGGLHFGPGAQIGGQLSAVNGGIELDHAHVAGAVSFYNGELDTGRDSHLDQGITVKKSQGWNHDSQKPPRIVVGPGSVVSGDIVLERTAEVFVHQSAHIGRVVGGTATPFSGDAP